MGIRFSKKIDHLNTKLFSGKKKKNQMQSRFLIYRVYVDIERFLNVIFNAGCIAFAVLHLSLLNSSHLF